MKWSKKTVFNRKQFLGSKRSRTKVMKSILKSDKQNVLNQYRERKELFDTIKKYQVGKGKVTNEGLRMALTELKYDNTNSLSKKEIKTLASELGVKGKINKRTLRKSKKFLNKKKDRLIKQFKKTHKKTKQMENFLPDFALGGMIAPINQFVSANDRDSNTNKESIFRQQLKIYKASKVKNKDKKVINTFDIFNKKKHSTKLNKNYIKNNTKKHNVIIDKDSKNDKLENFDINLEKKDIYDIFEKKDNKIPPLTDKIKKKDNKIPPLTDKIKKKDIYKSDVAKNKEIYKNRYRIDLESRKDEYKSRYRTKRKKEALEKISKYLQRDKEDIKENIKGVDKYRQRYLNKKEEEKERYRIDVAKQKEEYKDRYRIKVKEDIAEKKFKKHNKDKINNEQKNNTNKKNISRIENKVMSASDYRGKGDREVKITEESLKHAFKKDNRTNIEKEKVAYIKRNKKKEDIIKDIDNFIHQIEFSPAPQQKYINPKNKLNYIEIDTIKKKFLPKKENIEK